MQHSARYAYGEESRTENNQQVPSEGQLNERDVRDICDVRDMLAGHVHGSQRTGSVPVAVDKRPH